MTVHDGTAALTGFLLAALLPVGTPWWAVIIGAAVAVVLGRQIFGGFGGNPFNPVMVGWVVLQLSWPQAVNTFFDPVPLFEGLGKMAALDPTEMPLGLLDFGANAGVAGFYPLSSILVGGIPGGIGATSVIALLLGGGYLIHKKVIPWQIPTGFLGGLFLFSLIFWLADSSTYANPFYHLFFGYTLIGAFFLATDINTSPYTSTGAIIYGVGIGCPDHDYQVLGGLPGRRDFRDSFPQCVDPGIGSYQRRQLRAG